MKHDEVDVCIVGSGAGGGPLAYTLAQAGVSVVVLEKGPWYKTSDFVHDEITTCRRDFFSPFVSNEPHLIQRAGEASARKTTDGWIAHCVGGGTVHMSGFFYRMHQEDFTMASRYPQMAGANLADWPFLYEELSPYYDRVERIIGVSGEAGQYPNEPPRSGPYPFPPLAANPLSALVDTGATKLGLHPFQTPRAIVSTNVAEAGRAGCNYCQFCASYGCEVGAKSSTLASVIPMAVATGKCQVRPRSMAFEVALGSDGLVKSVRYFTDKGEIEEQKARVIVLSATAIESARLLLNSTSSRFPKGLANGNGLVGKNLSFSTLGKGYGQFDVASLPKELQAPHSNHFLQRSLQDDYFIKERKGSYDKGGTILFLLPHRNPIFAATQVAERGRYALFGEELKKALVRSYKEVREIEFEIFGEFLPSPQSYIGVESSVRDRFGIPVAKIHLKNHEEDRRNSRLLVDRALAVLRAAGAQKTGLDAVGATTFVLQQGTCRAGKDPQTSVLDPFCRSHEVKNLYVVDGSFLPTSGGVPSTLTIMANSFRVGDHLVSELGKRNL